MSISANNKADVRVTVIIPAYRAAETLIKAANSVLTQTEQNIELIIIDDCSPDATWEVAQSIALRDVRVRLFRLPENRGKPYTVNYATTQARGEWIAILDADDWYAPERVEQLVGAAETANADMAADNHVLFDAKANALVGTLFPRRGHDYVMGLDAFLAYADPPCQRDYGLLKPVFRASFIRTHTIEYYEPARVGEDYYVLLCFFAAGGRALITDEAYYYYTQPFGSISRQWAQGTRMQYNYALMKQVHDHFVDQLRARLSPAQLKKLNGRGRGIEALVFFSQVQECMARGDIWGAFKCVITAPGRFWLLAGQHAYERLQV